jgi:hypothetical protein
MVMDVGDIFDELEPPVHTGSLCVCQLCGAAVANDHLDEHRAFHDAIGEWMRRAMVGGV